MNDNLIQDDLPRPTRQVMGALALVLCIMVSAYWIDILLRTYSEDQNISTFQKNNYTIIISIVENLVAGSVAAVMLALSYRWITLSIDAKDRITEIKAHNIRERLLVNAQKTINYIFMGNTATFVSTSVLPILKDARETSIDRGIEIHIIDPMEIAVIGQYVNFKNDTPPKPILSPLGRFPVWGEKREERKPESSHDVLVKLLTAIYLSAYASTSATLKVELYLRKSFTPFRADITESEAVLTQESAKESAVSFSKHVHFYSWYNKEVQSQRMQSKKIAFSDVRNALLSSNLAEPGNKQEKNYKHHIELVITILNNYFNKTQPGYKLDFNESTINATAAALIKPNHGY
jgi:hypothetical protein